MTPALDPARAPRRDDLPWLRHRARPRAAAPASNGGGIRYVHDRPAAKRSPRPASLDLDRPTVPASLDLDETPTPPPAARSRPEPATRRAPITRVAAGQRRIITADEPTVTLTRLQSGIGTLEIDAAVPTADLRIGALFELADGYASTVDLAAGRRTAPAPPRAPVLVARRERFEQIAVDLRRSIELRRLAVYGLSASRQPLQWSGTLVVTTFGGGRIELPLESLPAGSTAVLLSVYNVRGEFVLRAEMEVVDGGVRDAARAYGYDRITWLDDRNPVG